jgi:hypothetical protein
MHTFSYILSFITLYNLWELYMWVHYGDIELKEKHSKFSGPIIGLSLIFLSAYLTSPLRCQGNGFLFMHWNRLVLKRCTRTPNTFYFWMMMSDCILGQSELLQKKWRRSLRYARVFSPLPLFLLLTSLTLKKAFFLHMTDIYPNWIPPWLTFWQLGKLLHIWISHGKLVSYDNGLSFKFIRYRTGCHCNAKC